MERRRFGKTDLYVSPMGLGCWGISGDWGPVDRAQAVRTLQRAFELGVTFFDTADRYGHGQSEQLVRAALAPQRHEIVIATKGGMNFYEGGHRPDFRPDYIEFALEQSLKRLGTDYVDLYQLHNPEPAHLCEELFARLEGLRDQGKIRYFGVSLNSRMQGLEELGAYGPVSLQVIYNLLDQRAAQQVFPWALAHGAAATARVPLGSGRLSGKSRWVAAMMRTLHFFNLPLPTRSKVRSCNTRSNLTCIGMLISPISSRNNVPPSASSNRPTRAFMAPVNAPFSWPKSSLSSKSGGIAPQFIGTNGPRARVESSCTVLATNSFPVPDCPVTITVVSKSETCSISLRTPRIEGELPVRRCRRSCPW